MSTSKSTGASRLGRDSAAQRLGIKIYGGQTVKVGQIVVRQRGTKYLAGSNMKKGGDDTLYAAITGTVKFSSMRKKLFNGKQRLATVVHVLPK